MFYSHCPQNLSHQPQLQHINIHNYTPAQHFPRLSLTCNKLRSSIIEEKSFRVRACPCVRFGLAIVESTKVSSSYLSLRSVRIAYAEPFDIPDGFVQLKTAKMTKPNVGVDSAETINRFIAQMRSGRNTSSGAAVITRQASPELVSEQRDDTVYLNGDVPNGAGFHRTEPIDIPVTRSSHSTTPNRNSPASPGHHATASPHVSGLRPPQNTPKTNPVSPRVSPGRSYDDELADVSHVVSTIVDTLDTKPLSHSIWAPKSGEYHRSSLSAFSTPSRDLTPVRVVEVNPAINDSFTRMSFKVADSDPEIGRPLIGEHLYKSPPSKTASKQIKSIPSRSQKSEAEIVPKADRGIVKASHSAANGSPTLRADGNKVRFQATPSPETPKPLTFSNLIQKESAASPSAQNPLPPRTRKTSNSSLATIGSSIAQSDELDTEPLLTISTPRPTSGSSRKSSSTSGHTNQATIGSSQRMLTTTAGTETNSAESTTLVADDHLVAALQNLASTGSLKPEESALLADLASRILHRTKAAEQSEATEQSEASESTSEPGNMDLPNNFLDKWASKPKNTKENAAHPSQATRASSNRIVNSGSAADGAPRRIFSQPEAAQRPPLAAKATNSAAKPAEDTEDREHKTFFNAWPQLEQRDRPGM